MVKSINVFFEDDDYDKLITAKGEISWRDFILTLVSSKK